MKKQCKNEYGFSAIILIIIGILLTAAAGTGGYFLSKKINAPQQQPTQQPATQQEKSTSSTTNAPQKSINEILSPENQNEADQIIWNSPQEISSLKIFNDAEGKYREEGSKYYKVGVFADEKYKDGELILLSAPWEDPDFYPAFYRFARKNGNLTLLKKYSDSDGDGLVKSRFSIDEDYVISSLEFPKSFNGPRSRQVLELQSGINAFFSINNLIKSFTDNKLGDIYTSDNFAPPNDIFDKNGFYIKSPDGAVKVYSLVIDFVGKDNIPAITWEDGSQNKNEYTSTDVGGCGSQNYISVVSDINIGDLEIIGKNSKNDTIYRLKDSNHSLLKHIYNDVYTVFDGRQKVSYEEFLASHPVFFWKDPFDRLIKFQNNKFMTAAECGKPVIYLYPEKPERISVTVEPAGGMTYSDPLYENGWIVNADTNSNLTEIKSGKTYPYLFWEGRGGIYEQPEKGFVVKKENIHNFLIEKLARLGLNQKEATDFI